MDRTTGYLYPVLQGLPPGLEARESRQQRRMNIDNPPSERRKERGFDNPHETGEHYQVYPGGGQGFHIGRLGGFVQLGPKGARRNVAGLNSALLRFFQNARVGDVT